MSDKQNRVDIDSHDKDVDTDDDEAAPSSYYYDDSTGYEPYEAEDNDLEDSDLPAKDR